MSDLPRCYRYLALEEASVRNSPSFILRTGSDDRCGDFIARVVVGSCITHVIEPDVRTAKKVFGGNHNLSRIRACFNSSS